MIPCNNAYGPKDLDMGYAANRLGLDEWVIRKRLHKLKDVWGLGGADRVTICLHDGLVYVSDSEDEIGDLHDA
jgi:hypothetical protein